MKLFIFISLSLFIFCNANLFDDLNLIYEIEKKNNDKMPISLSSTLQVGYFTMPSARMLEEGNLSIGYSYLPPYRLYNILAQPFSRLELSFNYRIFHGILEPSMGPMGFGFDADRIANIKFACLKKSDDFDFLPEISIGLNDFMGTKRFNSFYIVTTKEFLQYNIETTLGWGQGRIKNFFAAILWSPFKNYSFLKNFSLIAEYDANDYKNHKYEHFEGKTTKTPFNIGAYCSFFNDCLRISANSIRGEDFSISSSFTYNLGKASSFFYKQKNNKMDSTKSISSRLNIDEIIKTFKEEGIEISSMHTTDQKNHLCINITNITCRNEKILKETIENLLIKTIPNTIDTTTIMWETDGILIQKIEFNNKLLNNYMLKKISSQELDILSTQKNINALPSTKNISLYKEKKKLFNSTAIQPDFNSYFGSRTGKFKYDAGIMLNQQGYLFNQLYYNFQLSYICFSTAKELKNVDFYNPSQILNVRSDLMGYMRQSSWHLKEAYIQKGFNINNGIFIRNAIGLFEIAYGGVSIETLYYSINTNFAIGAELSFLKKRAYSSLKFENKIRKFNKQGNAEFLDIPFFTQMFLDFYYKLKPLSLDLKISIGQFLAKDRGIKIETSRVFNNGFKIGGWYTITNANDILNNQVYFDKGVSLSVPLDLFSTKHTKDFFNYSIAAWLRDVGVRIPCGKSLYDTINE